jgi:S-adenosylmethionine decarboxylase
MIGATVLNVSKQDYEPQGASVTFLIAEGSLMAGVNGSNGSNGNASSTKNAGVASGAINSETVVAHLDKSHVTVHTYPEYHPGNTISTFRVDIDVATCGEITPLSTLDFLIGSFDSDIITMDYRVRGFTRDVTGKKLYIDHDITSIQDYIDESVLEHYDAIDINVYQSNIFHTKMLIKDVDLQDYLFNTDVYEIAPKTRLQITNSLRREMIEIFSGINVF